MHNTEKKYYDFPYESLPRWSSYWYQIHEVLSKKPQQVLEIGIGNQVVSKYIKETGVRVTTLDINSELRPDIVASVTDIPLEENTQDVVLAAEILEHIPFEDFSKALGEIHRVTKKYAVISLPHWGSVIAGMLKIPFFSWLRFVYKLPGRKVHTLDENGHYWEIGTKGFPLSRITQSMKKAGFEIVSDYCIVEYPYHHFFILKKKET